MLKINQGLVDYDENLVIKITTTLFSLIINDQDQIKKRQKIIAECLKTYNDILKNYSNQSIKMNKLKELAKLSGYNNSSNKDKIMLDFLINKLRK